MGRVKFKDFEYMEESFSRGNKRKHRKVMEDYEELDELVEEFMTRKQEELRKHHRQIRDKYFHDEV